ncbi:tyrosine-protein kinase receptor TYRO3 isoform X2 [Puntigrus tetrazona]|uniref:tyrosine-protein kinase receptor TYRO3 isoform X2 n=1 Tax=Puntigrus tetrazona TaxID=1606681 RepID=UPI001C88E51B|nr:tyrosine-protein kinase receptor TYRO3 isoform X2 [Puntigrus tetrazona]
MFYILLSISLVVSAQPTPIREEVFDSSKQRSLKWTFSPPKAWKETQMQLGKNYTHTVYQACNPELNKDPKTLWTNWIPKQDAHELFLDLSFAQADKQSIYIYVRESSQRHFQYFRKPQRQPLLNITVLHPFPDALPQDEHLSHAKGLKLGKISQKGFYLGFSYSGKCTFIASIQVFFLKCPTLLWNQIVFEETAAGGLQRGACVNGSVEINGTKIECRRNGTWSPPQGLCVVDTQHQTDRTHSEVRPSSSLWSASDSTPSPVLTAGLVCSALLFLILIAVVFIFVKRHKLSGGQETELVSTSGVTRYRRPQEEVYTAQPEPVNTFRVSSCDQTQSAECKPCPPRSTTLGEEVSQSDYGYEQLHTDSTKSAEMSDGPLCDLRDVMVERTKLKMGQKLGKGEFGAVYEGVFSTQKGQDIRVAVKTLKGAVHSKEDLESFLKEAEIMKHFHHVNVVKLLGVALEPDPGSSFHVPLVILPFMKHGDLHSFLRATRYGDVPMFVPHQSLLGFMIDIAAGMEYLSLQGFLHRDLAARNCMLGDDLHVCVADFGLSKNIYSSNYYRQKNMDVSLPVRWMAIESLSDFLYTTKSDVWSFGITMWEITSRGKIPYPGISGHELLDFLENGHRLKKAKNDSKLYELMLSCWHRDPSQRPGFGELGQSLKALLSELPTLEASNEDHYINLGLKAASDHQDSAGTLEPEGERMM